MLASLFDDDVVVDDETSASTALNCSMGSLFEFSMRPSLIDDELDEQLKLESFEGVRDLALGGDGKNMRPLFLVE